MEIFYVPLTLRENKRLVNLCWICLCRLFWQHTWTSRMLVYVMQVGFQLVFGLKHEFWWDLRIIMQKTTRPTAAHDCLLWTGQTRITKGRYTYGRVSNPFPAANKTAVLSVCKAVHKLHDKSNSYELPLYGDARSKFEISHICHLTLCINLDHLTWETHTIKQERLHCKLQGFYHWLCIENMLQFQKYNTKTNIFAFQIGILTLNLLKIPHISTDFNNLVSFLLIWQVSWVLTKYYLWKTKISYRWQYRLAGNFQCIKC